MFHNKNHNKSVIKTWVDSMIWFVDNKPKIKESGNIITRSYKIHYTLHCVGEFPALTKTIILGRAFKRYVTIRKEYRQNGFPNRPSGVDGKKRPTTEIFNNDGSLAEGLYECEYERIKHYHFNDKPIVLRTYKIPTFDYNNIPAIKRYD